MKSTVRPVRRRSRFHTLEALESRIAPANFQLPAGGGPYTLELDPLDSHLHITNSGGGEIFDQGLTPDTLTLTAAGTDNLTIRDTAAGSVHFTGTLDVNIAGTIQITGALSTQGAGSIDLVTLRNISVNSGSSIIVADGEISLTNLASITGNYAGITVDGLLSATGIGNIILNGTGGNTGSANHGIIQHGQVAAATGSVTYTGHGGVGGVDNNIGITIPSGSGISVGSGNVNLQGTAGTDAGQSVGIELAVAISTSADAHFTTDTGLQFDAGASVTTTGTTFIQAPTAATTVHVGTTQHAGLGVTNTILNDITAAFVQIGSPTGGNIVVDGATTAGTSLFLATSGGITGAAALTLTAGKTLSTLSNNAVNLTGAITAPGGVLLQSDAAHLIDVTLTNAGNELGTVAIDHGANISLRDATGFDLGNISFGTKLTVQSSGAITQSGALTGGGQLFKTGTGTLTLSAANTIGDTTIQMGTLQFSNPGAFGTGTVFLGDVTTGSAPVSLLAATAFNQGVFTTPIVVPNIGSASVATIGTIAGSPPSPASFSGPLSLNRPTTLQGGFAGLTSFIGVISGNPTTLTIAGNGNTVGLGGSSANTFTGTVMVTGTTELQLNPGVDDIPDNASVDLAAGAFLKFFKAAGANETINALTGTGTVEGYLSGSDNPVSLTIGAGGASFTFSGTLQDGASPVSLIKIGAGTATLGGAQTYSGSTTISGGTLALVGTADNALPSTSSIEIQSGAHLDVTGLSAAGDPQTLRLVSGQSLFGVGVLDGSLTTAGSIKVGSPTSTGILTINGGLTSTGSLFFKVNDPYVSAGFNYDQIIVTGGVDLSGATFQYSGGAFIPTGSPIITLISKIGAGAIVPATSAAQGSTVFIGQAGFSLSYQGGDSNDLVLTTAVGQLALAPVLTKGMLSITDTVGRPNHMFITYSLGGIIFTDAVDMFTAAPAGGTLIDNGHSILFDNAKSVKGITFEGGGGDDVLTLNLFEGKLPAGGLTFNGGGQATAAGDQLVINSGDGARTAGDEGTVTYNFTNAHDGSISMSGYGKITYTGLEPVINQGSAKDIIFNLPASVTQNAVTLGDNGVAGDGLSRLSGSTFELTDFVNPTRSLTINRGTQNDTLTIDNPVDFDSSLVIGDDQHPFFRVGLTTSFALTGLGETLDLKTNILLLPAGQTIAAPGGLLAIQQGSLDGTIAGGLSLAAVGSSTSLDLNGANFYTGDTFVVGPLTLGSAFAAQNSTIHVLSDFALQFAMPGGGNFTIGGLAGPGDVPLQDDSGVSAAPITLQVGNNNGVASYSGHLTATGSLLKIGAGTQTLTGSNDHTGTFLISGTLQINSDRALGHAGNTFESDGGTLRAIATFKSTRPILLGPGDTDFAAAAGKTMTLAGVLSGAGSYHIDGPGTVLITNPANTNSGSFEIDSDGNVTVNGLSITAPGAKGDVMITPGATPNSVAKIDLTPAKKPISLILKGPKNGTIETIMDIVSDDTTSIKKIVLGPGVRLGDGTGGDVDLNIDGMLGSLQMDMVTDNTTITLGKDLAYKDTYKNHPSLNVNKLGNGVTIDLTGDGVMAGGIGGGGLGKVIVNAWGTGGMVKTTQSVKSFTVKTGDFNGSIQVDPNHLGEFTVANMGAVSIPNGQWTGAGMQVEGVVAKFLTGGLQVGSVISAGAFGPVAIKNKDFAGSVVATADPTVKDKKGKVVATGDIASVNVTGNFTGMINGNGAVGTVSVTGTGVFSGTLRGGTLGAVTAVKFVGPNDGLHNTITSLGSIGNITVTTGSLDNYIIAAGTDLGPDAMFGGGNDHFASFIMNGAKKTAVSVGNVTVKGGVTGTTIVAGVNPGALGIYGDGDDTIATPVEASLKTKIGKLSFDTAGTLAITYADTPKPVNIKNAFEAQTMTSIQLSKTKDPATNYLTAFLAEHYIDAGGTPILVKQLI